MEDGLKAMSGTVIIIPSSNKKDEPVNTDILCNGIVSSSSLGFSFFDRIHGPGPSTKTFFGPL
tara:strand:- start:1301 stop:1489 length:189 start_codon:yes stop_codon:yes gene_type:complete